MEAAYAKRQDEIFYDESSVKTRARERIGILGEKSAITFSEQLITKEFFCFVLYYRSTTSKFEKSRFVLLNEKGYLSPHTSCGTDNSSYCCRDVAKNLTGLAGFSFH